MSTTREHAAGAVHRARTARTVDGRPSRRTPGGLRLTRRGRVAVTVLALGVAGVVGTTAQSAVAGGPSAPVPVVAHVVEPGETLWEIAARTAEPGQDVRDVVADLAELNGLGGVGLEVGQQLLVPVR